jgi:formate dehydrogenase iron-sulfur subunit
MSLAILYDATLCVGCRACEQACAVRQGLPWDDEIGAVERTSATKLTTVLTRGEDFMRRMCMHCQDPACVSVCPVGAFTKTPAGPVTYEEDKCMGCRYCMVACPFSVPKYEWNEVLPRVRKCDMCADLQAAGKPTECTDACPTGATIVGDRNELLAEARRRIEESPGSYHPVIYGEREAGGTSVLMLSRVPFEDFGFKTDITDQPLPLLTYRVLSKIPDFVVLGGVTLGGIWWITNRRNEVAAAERGTAASAAAAPAPGHTGDAGGGAGSGEARDRSAVATHDTRHDGGAGDRAGADSAPDRSAGEAGEEGR